MIHYKIYTTYQQLPNSWDTLVSHDIFLHSQYLKAIESVSPSNISMYYVGIFKDDGLVAVAVLQRVQLYVKDMFRNNNDSCFRERFKSLVSLILKGNILVLGNLTHTGQHGYFISNAISISAFSETLFKVFDDLKQHIKTHDKKRIRLFLLKDFFNTDVLHQERDNFSKKGFYNVKVQPNMLFQVPESWRSFDDYLKALNKKYRRRYKRARKKYNGIVCKELDLQTIKKDSKRLYQLYKTVSDNAKFNTFVLPENHFFIYKQELHNNFKVFGYYLNEELVGFYTLILNNNNDLETYFLGYDERYQYNMQLYLNMLYDMIAFGVNNGFKTIVYARTAMAIKSSVGAKDYPMTMYMKHTNGIINALFKQIFKLMNPKKDWEERHPFSK
ncbi:GNAT family N-acetyltransferase [Mangrovimonas spongiae]|uniref:GNAT family N-acetyltransferase n=1 Tax=Mangrovimonas spongiae TaxID=2494697 RepID=A0A3R9P0F4_9FLAO|nr:GNAT family N-acetyltransferase [Mangrovimonas spongiae]RSK41547.1 GNAT family N-acetyltransferase [Mangrovimonas spongiae]